MLWPDTDLARLMDADAVLECPEKLKTRQVHDRPPSCSPDSSQFRSTCSSLPQLQVGARICGVLKLPDARKLHTECMF